MKKTISAIVAYIMTGYEWQEAYEELSREYDNFCGEFVQV